MAQGTDDWLSFLNAEARSLKTLASEADKGDLRCALVDALVSQYKFPMKVTFRGYVARERVIKKIKVRAGDGGTEEADKPYLEVVPERYSQEAWDLLGGILVPMKRGLQPGSVLELTLDIQSPKRYKLSPPGILSSLRSCDIVVGVEA
ncbi:MAG TPA: hypothetical protein VM681_02315 [Candidatus Thermoplasmatota archaeon]|nr:hypothetical protein [Candidatus Thermoplasmatota archaeon]